MYNLTHDKRAVFENVIPYHRFRNEAACTYPLGILGFELSVEFISTEAGGNWVEIGRSGVDWRRSSELL